MGAQSSTGHGGAASGSGSPSGSPGSLKAAPFAAAHEPSDTPSRRCKPPWPRPLWQARSSHSPPGDVEARSCHLEAGASSSNQTVIVNIDPEPTQVRRPSKMSIESFGSVGSVEEYSPSVASHVDVDSRPSSSRDFGLSHSSSFSDSRPASASSRRASFKTRCTMGGRDPTLVQAEKLAKLSLEQLEQQDFVAAREAWGVSTPSTVASNNMSRTTSSLSSTACGSRPTSSAASISSSSQSNDPNVKLQLKEARQRAKASFAALQSELRGSAHATPARYATWPIGCVVKIAVEDPAYSGAFASDDSEPTGLMAILVSYDKSLNTFEVKLHDGSMRTVPAQRVSRASARDRLQAQSNFSGQPPHSRHDLQSKVRSLSAMPPEAATMPEAISHQAASLHSQTPQIPRDHFDSAKAMESPTDPMPRMLGRAHSDDES